MSGVGDAAAAILGAQPGPAFFPRVGVITAIVVVRVDPYSVAVTRAVGIRRLTVTIDGLSYDCGASGAFLAEVTASGGRENVFIGRQVKVENIGGSPLVAYTTNWS